MAQDGRASCPNAAADGDDGTIGGVAGFVPFTERSTIPSIGDIETDTLDFKARSEGRTGRSTTWAAKDVAAFANADGGVLIIGAYEDNRRGYLGLIKGMTDEDVKIVRDTFSDAAKEICRPSPVNNSVLLQHGTDKLVAVNVWPFPGHAVGIKVDPDTWRFPVRRGLDTPYLTPERLPMLMLPELRRKISLLRSIEPGSRVTINQGFMAPNDHWTFVEVVEEDNAVHFEKPVSNGKELVHVALEQIERVWRRHGDWWMHTGPVERTRI